MTAQSDNRLLFLGTGGSMGIPLIGCRCDVCLSSSPYNQRLRSSALLTIRGKRFLIDAGPDLRTQALRWGIDALDGVLFTHAHHDHTAGLDELRIYYMRAKKPLPCLLSQITLDDIKKRFCYIFNPDPHSPQLLPKFAIQVLTEERGSLLFEGIEVQYFTYHQLGMAVNGFRFGDLAYVSDIRHYPESIFSDLKGVRHLIVSALRFKPSPMHFTVDEAVEFAAKTGAAHTWLTHLAHELDHDRTNHYLPREVRLAYDGLEINFLF